MPIYSQKDTLRVAKRFNNTKRTYLLVNPLQAKHIPVSPAESLRMMGALGDMLAGKYPGTRLVIGFAETATAIGAVAASRFADNCVYLHTTREAAPEVSEWVLFSEEHSHAVEQKLCGDRLPEWIAGTESIIFVDDEISTGKTLVNMIRQLRQRYPSLGDKRLVAASLLNRLSPENERRLSGAGLQCECLVKLPEADYAEAVAALSVQEAPPVKALEMDFFHKTLDCASLPDARKGVLIQDYMRSCGEMARAFVEDAAPALGSAGSAVVLGTEECMYPALALGEALERLGLQVRCHATTRSPIGLCGAPGYPVASGRKLRSFYADARDTYIYNLSHCDALIVVSDAPTFDAEALKKLAAAWKPYGYQKLFFIQGGRDVWYI